MNKLKGATIAMGMLAVVSCNTKQGTGSLIGGGGGAIIGGIIGKLAGNTAVGAAIGGAVGAGTGALWISRERKCVPASRRLCTII